MILGGIFLVIVIGIGGFCSVFGSLLNSMPAVELGPTLTQNIDVPVPDSSDTPNLSLKVSGGQFSLAPGAKKGLIEGTVTYDAPQLEPQIETNGRNIRIYPKEDIGLDALAEEFENTWDVKLGSAPMELTINAGGADTEIELGGLSVVDLAIFHGGDNFHLSFSEPNQIEMKKLKFIGGASITTTLTRLANARAENISFAVGAGDFTLDFSGELQNDVDVDVTSGLSTITIIVPEGVAAHVSSSWTMPNVEMIGSWQKSDDTTYILPGEGHKITIKVDGLGADLKLRTP